MDDSFKSGRNYKNLMILFGCENSTVKTWWSGYTTNFALTLWNFCSKCTFLLFWSCNFWPSGFCHFWSVSFNNLIHGLPLCILPTSWNPILYLRFYRIWSIQYGLFHSAEHLNVTVKTEAFSFWPICKWLFIISIHISDFESLPLLWIKMKRSKQTL